MDYSFFALGLIGALVGYIIGDFQRERRYRRESRSNLARANDRYANSHADTVRDSDAVAVSDVDNDDNAKYWDGRQSGRRAIPRPDVRARVGRYAARGSVSFADAAPLTITRRMVEHDC